MYYKHEIGSGGEIAACQYLECNNYTIVDKNFTCKSGEIDIIAKDKNYLVFIEVKTRKSNDYGYPSEFVNRSKQQKIIKTAEYYLMLRNIKNYEARFDVIEVISNKKDGKTNIENINLIKNAFEKRARF